MSTITVSEHSQSIVMSKTETMRAVTFAHYGDHSELSMSHTVPRPEPGADEVLTQISASSVNRGDWHYLHGTPFPLRFMAGGLITPKRNIPGGDAVGTIEAVGSSVEAFKPGDAVMADLSNSGFGAWAEYATCKAAHVVQRPEGLSDEQAAIIPIAALTALQGLRDHAQLKAGESVLINGATGGVGMYAALIAKQLGATVTVVGSSKKAAFLDQLGADQIIYYDESDFLTAGKQYDVLVDAAAYRPFYKLAKALNEQGRYLMIGGSMSNFARIALLGPLLSRKQGRQYLSFLQAATPEDMKTMADWVANGEIKMPQPEVFPMAQASEAMRLMEQRQLTGKVCLRWD